MATVNPVLQGITRDEAISDPFVRELYFGSADTPGLIAQATQAAQKSFLDQPPILQQTAGLTPDELRAREITRAGIGSFQPFLNRAEQAYGRGLGALQSSIGFGGPSARQLLGLSLQQYDPRMARTFYDPFEEQVVQQTIQDTLKAAAQQDIQQRAADIARGGESAFGSRARLTAGERQAAIGRGLGEVLGKIRSGGFQTAQQRALEELQRQRDAASRASQLEAGFGGDISAAQRLFGSDIAGLGAEAQRLRGIDVSQLEGLGATQRNIEEQRLARQYAQQQAQRQAPLQAATFVKGFAPQYVSGRTDVQKTYGMPVDPLGLGIGAALGAYRGLRREPQPDLSAYDRAAAQGQQAIQRAEIGQNLRLPSSIGTQQQFPTSQYGYTDYSNMLASPYQPPTSPYVPGRVNLPSSLPGQSPTVNNPGPYTGFDPTNPGAGLPYNVFGGTP